MVEESNGSQIPWDYNSLDFALRFREDVGGKKLRKNGRIISFGTNE